MSRDHVEDSTLSSDGDGAPAAADPKPAPRPAPIKRGATAPKPPPCVGNGPPQSQRRAAIEYLSRELRSLEIEASHTAKLEDQIEILEARCKRAEQTAQMFLRRCQMLEQELKNERASKEAPSTGGASSLAAAAAHLPTLAPTSTTGALTSLGAAAATLPPPPQITAPPPPASPAAGVSDGQPSCTTGADADDDDFDLDALISAQRNLPVPGARSEGAAKQPLRLRPDS